MNLPALKKINESAACTRWEAQFPSTMTKQGGTYRVTTYPNSELVYVETWVRCRRVTGNRVIEAIKAALTAYH